MKEKYIFLFVCEITALAICVIRAVIRAGFMDSMVPYTLLVCCLLGFRLVARLSGGKLKKFSFLPLALAILITFFAFGLSPYALIVLPVALYGALLHKKLQKKSALLLTLSEENENLREQISRQKYSQENGERFVRLNERNRIAARLHDKIGHGISGSTLLLEGALLNFEKNPEISKEAISNASENLRQTVDEIRRVLREERRENAKIGPAEIAGILIKFETDYPRIKTELIVENADEIAPDIWTCLAENLAEALTNVLKHSDADNFKAAIISKNGLIRAEFSDNGSGKKPITAAGIGLSAMRERTAFHQGRLFINSENGFTITQIFTKKGGE
ncbi:MAG: histidine kinase [Oscillospiraceae bacterium]|jgi:signal transduction histidine kinase|nr:histidine kinase [Oscillospiraceae bacterium]